MPDCLICGKGNADRPTVFRDRDWCSENHRKDLIEQEIGAADREDIEPDLQKFSR